jgi:thiaminase/transcriptional activator TenA
VADEGDLMPPLSERLRAANQGAWDAMQAHRFVRDIEDDTISREIFGRYLVHEQAFVETAILIFGHALLKAPDFSARRVLCGVLSGLGGGQLGYFDRAFAACGIAPGERDTLPGAVIAFDRGMLRMAETGSYFDIMAIMLAAEWMYATWCARAHTRPNSDPLIAEWVRLHAEPAFLAQAEWLRNEIDRADVDAAAARRLSDLFGRALALEIAFHEAAYGDVPPTT